MSDAPFIPATEQELFPPVGTDEPDARHIHEQAIKWQAQVTETRVSIETDKAAIVSVRTASASSEHPSVNVSDLEQQPDGTYRVVETGENVRVISGEVLPARVLPNQLVPPRKPSERVKRAMQERDDLSQRGHTQAYLNEIGIEIICDMIKDDMSYRDIAQELGLSKTALIDWLDGDSDRTTRARLALRFAAAEAAQKGENVLLELDEDASPAMIVRARELAQHYRWKAKVRNPQEYGDKQQIEHVAQAGIDAAMALAKKLYDTPVPV